MILRAVHTKDRFGWNLVTAKLKFQRYFASTLFKLFSGTMCGCKSWDGIKDEHKRYAINVKVLAYDAGWNIQPRQNSLCFLFCFPFAFVTEMEMKSFIHDLPSRWQSDGCWKTIFRHYLACMELSGDVLCCKCNRNRLKFHRWWCFAELGSP